ncbi:MAG: M20/M25/M40 family metallo-hydrolase [Chloroflexi bacterium]|nr:M20/M25/M40 family metallo-hydrolase [Chloroflexota bacterium]
MSNKEDLEKKVLDKIDQLEPEMVKVALDLADTDSFQPNEKVAGDYLYAWCQENGFGPQKIGAPHRFNVLAKYKGTGKGHSLLFCSHLDGPDGGTGPGRELAKWRYRYPDAPFRTHAWREGDAIIGGSINNCKGPMACWLIATKAINDLGIKLLGDIVLTAVVGETGGAPVDEFEAPEWDSHEVGARYIASHGGIADFALVAEWTDFTLVPMENGFAYFKITTYAGPATYTPSLSRPEPSREKSVNAIVRMAKFIERFEQYADEYTKENTYSFDGSTVVPNASIGAIRGGIPPNPIHSPEVCSIYCDFRIPPGKNPLDIQRHLKGILEEMEMDSQVEMYKYLPGYQAWHNNGFDVLKNAVVEAHTRLFNKPPQVASRTLVSMWRDVNAFNELGVPAISYGFIRGRTPEGAGYIKIADMITAAKVYALTALDICNRPYNGS